MLRWDFDEFRTEEVHVASWVVSSAMSKIFFDSDRPEVRGVELNILAAGIDLEAAQSLASLRGDNQPTYFVPSERSLEQVPLSVGPTFD